MLWEFRGPIGFFLGMSSMISQKMVTGKLFGDANKHYIYTSKFVECVFKFADSYKWFPTPTTCEKGAYIDTCEGVEGCAPLAQNCEVGSVRNQVLQTNNPCQSGCKRKELTGTNAPYVSGNCPKTGMQPAPQYETATFYDSGQIPMFDEFDAVYIVHTWMIILTVAMMLHQLVAFGKQIGFGHKKLDGKFVKFCIEYERGKSYRKMIYIMIGLFIVLAITSAAIWGFQLSEIGAILLSLFTLKTMLTVEGKDTFVDLNHEHFKDIVFKPLPLLMFGPSEVVDLIGASKINDNKERMNSLIEEGTEKYIYFVNTTKRGEELEGYTTAVYDKPPEESP